MRNHAFSLQPFEPPKIDLQITGEITRLNHTLTLNYALKGDLEKIEIPTTVDIPTRKDRLWETTCFELFLGKHNYTHYWEFNLSPSGDWNIYRFERYREVMELEHRVIILPFNVIRDSNSLFLELEFNMQCLTSIDRNFDVSITTVIKHKTGDTSYWAVKHCGEKADFHLRDSFLFYV
ncbi:DOMON-like domain-containing protein [Rivularia sp. UHCC 0363]|uniref:DOMON-like domain-containing protein n=1 Tax=Rivularia sp. UHCC 0363 TaxID=3110244 RepID=UPI002B1FFAA4|nr:DOMON-like domain-containing protein [Rivularia sp. UHCC 0363]MEA5594915.1 DOMON-like domain-containing protein [Rivularia sp. UHCC 0363]